MRKLLPILLILFLQSVPNGLSCQVTNIGEKAVFSADQIAIMSDGTSLIGGTYGNNAEVDGNLLPHKGKIDLFLGMLGSTGFVKGPWILQSREEDSWTSISTVDQNFMVTGSFWDSLWVNESLLGLSPLGKAGFALLADEEFSGPLELFLVEGNGFKNVNTSYLAGPDDFYIAGSFTDSLFFLDTFLVSPEGRNAFVVHVSEGQVERISQFGDAADMDISTMTICQGKLYLGGSFLGAFTFAEDTLETQTSDVDGFLVSFDLNFQPQKGFQFGGVFPDNVRDCKCDGQDLWVGGDFLGVLKLDKNTRLESNGFETDLFTILVSSPGEIIQAQRWGGTGGEILESMILSGEKIFMGGYFTGEMNVGGEIIFTPPGKINGYILKSNKSFNKTRLRQVISSERSSVEMLSPTRDTGFVGCGFYGEDLKWENEEIFSPIPFQAYLLELNHLTTIQNSTFDSNEVQIYPNPTKDLIWINSSLNDLKFLLYNAKGSLVLEHEHSGPIDVSHLSCGMYFYNLISGRRIIQTGKLIKD